jgi:type VI secretion system protein ImpM
MDDQASAQPQGEIVSLFGKLPTVLDYVRIHHDSPAAIALDEWLSRALQDLTIAGQTFSSARYRFLFAPHGCAHALLGVLGPSKDRAGRKFPLSVFTRLPVRAIARNFASAPRAASAFFSAADQLLDGAATLTREDAVEQLARLPTPSAQAFDSEGGALRHQLAERSFAAFSDSLFAGQPSAAEAALGRAVGTLAQVRMAPGERVSVLDCPVNDDQDVLAWLTLTQSMLSWSQDVPSLFWTTRSEPGRLLVALGAPPPALPLWLADRKKKSERLIVLTATTALAGGSLNDASVCFPSEPSLVDEDASSGAHGPSLLDKLDGFAASA